MCKFKLLENSRPNGLLFSGELLETGGIHKSSYWKTAGPWLLYNSYIQVIEKFQKWSGESDFQRDSPIISLRYSIQSSLTQETNLIYFLLISSNSLDMKIWEALHCIVANKQKSNENKQLGLCCFLSLHLIWPSGIHIYPFLMVVSH